MAKQFLDSPDIIPTFQKVGGEGMSERVTADTLGDAGPGNGFVDCTLHEGRIDVVSALNTSDGILPTPLLGKHPLPRPIDTGVGIFFFKRCRQGSPAPAFGDIVLMNVPHLGEMGFEGSLEAGGQHGDPILAAFAVADENLVLLEVDVLDAEFEAFHEAQSGAVHEGCGEAFVAAHLRKELLYFHSAHDDGQAFGFFGPDDVAEVVDGNAQDVPEEEQDRGERLVLG